MAQNVLDLTISIGLEWWQISAQDDRSQENESVFAEQLNAKHLAYRLEGLEPPDLFYLVKRGEIRQC